MKKVFVISVPDNRTQAYNARVLAIKKTWREVTKHVDDVLEGAMELTKGRPVYRNYLNDKGGRNSKVFLDDVLEFNVDEVEIDD